jgi:pyrroline-5-carboxylate reductase
LAPGRTLGVIGAGIMGRTLVRGLLDAGLATPAQVWAGARSEASCARAARELGIAAAVDYRAFLTNADVILVCVKPAQIAEVAATLRRAGLSGGTLMISILAGVTTERLRGLVDSPWVRSLPNTPSLIGAGMTAICPGPGTTAEQLATASRIFAAVGRCETVHEGEMNAVTALAGCSPAYFYTILDAMSDAGVRLGVERDLALRLAAQAMCGAARMVLETGKHPGALRDEVTTPGGSTIAGLRAMEDGNVRAVVAGGIEAAAHRVDEMSRAQTKS